VAEKGIGAADVEHELRGHPDQSSLLDLHLSEALWRAGLGASTVLMMIIIL
jgi:hypothetical protein